MDEDPRRYPLVRYRRPARGGRWLGAAWAGRRRGRKLIAALVVAAALLGGAWAIRRAARPDPRQELALSEQLLHAGNYSAARNHALAAAAGAPGWAEAYAALARAYLLLGEGVPAEGALIHAQAAGYEMAGAHHLLAEAALLQGDPDRALAEAAKAGPRFAGAAARVSARARAAKGDPPAARATLEAMLARDPRDAATWADLGRIRFDAGDVGGASEAATRAARLDPANLAALTLLGELVRSRYGLTASLPWFAAALRRDAYYVPALLDQAAALGDSGRYIEMLDATRRALAARPGEPHALYLEAVLAARSGRRVLARALIARTGGALDHMPGMLLLAGALDEADGRHEHAIETWRELVARQPLNIVARRLLGAALLRSGDARGALDALRPVALRADADAYTLTLVARGFEAIGERDWAARFLDRAAGGGDPASAPFGSDDGVPASASAVDESPDDPERLIDLVRAELEGDKATEALGRAKTLAAAGSGAPAAWVALGDVDTALNRPADALVAYTRAADLRFDEPTMLRLVAAQAQTGARAQAAQTLALYLAQNPGGPAAECIAARLRLAAGDWSGAIRLLERARNRDGSRDVQVLTALSAAYLGAGDAAAARDYARAAYRLHPMNAAAADAYGWALYALGEDADARQLLSKASILAPDAAAIQAHLREASGRSRR